MARRVFFSFHYAKDVQRAQVVRNSWVTKPDREDAAFFDSSVFEASKRNGEAALKREFAGSNWPHRDGLKWPHSRTRLFAW